MFLDKSSYYEFYLIFGKNFVQNKEDSANIYLENQKKEYSQ